MKLRITAKVTFEYEPRPEAYREGATPEEMLVVDIAGYGDPQNVDMLLDELAMGNAKVEVTGEVVDV